MRRSSVVVSATILFAAGALASPAHAEVAGSGATPNLAVSFYVGAIQFDGPECARAPVIVDYVKQGAQSRQISGGVTFDLRYEGSNASSRPSVTIFSFDAESGRKETSISFCPYQAVSGAGPLILNGAVRSTLSGTGEVSADLPPSIVNVGVVPTQMSKVKVKKANTYYALSGTVTAQTASKGVIGAGGKVTIQLRKKGSKRWVAGPTANPDSFGNWSIFPYSILTKNYPKGTQFRAVFSDCRWCANNVRTGKLP